MREKIINFAEGFKTKIDMLEIGNVIPEFAAQDQNGNIVSSADLIGKKTVVYFFERSDLPNIYTFDTAVPVGIYDGKLSICVNDLI